MNTEKTTTKSQSSTISLQNKPRKANAIVAQVIISESELAKVIENYSCEYVKNNPAAFKLTLYNLGMNVTEKIEQQDNLKHRNRFNEVVLCSRWVGEERLDKAWIQSGYASREAIDKYSGSKILEDLYRGKNATEDAQIYLADRDKYTVIDETQWIE